jgi:hypothetical protein
MTAPVTGRLVTASSWSRELARSENYDQWKDIELKFDPGAAGLIAEKSFALCAIAGAITPH